MDSPIFSVIIVGVRVKASFEKLVPPTGESFRCFNRNELRTTVKWHRHPEIELNYVERGRGTRLIGDHIDTYGDGDLVLVGPDIPHTWLSDDYIGKKFDRHPSIVIQFLPESLGEKLFGLPEMEDVAAMLERSKRGLLFHGRIIQTVGTRITEMVQQHSAERLLGLLSCLSDLAHTENATPLASEGYSPAFSKDTDKRVQKICQYINTHLVDSTLDHASLAGLVGMNPSAFSRFFKRATGRTVTHYINEMRIGLACRMLTDTDQSVLDICMQTGYGNVSNFNRRFRELKLMTPRQFRARHSAMAS